MECLFEAQNKCKAASVVASSRLSVSGDDRKAARDVKRGAGRQAGSSSQTPLVAPYRAAFWPSLLTESLEQAKLLCIVVSVALNGESQSTQNPPNRSNSPFRATETTIHNNWGSFTFIFNFNLNIPRYKFSKFTIWRLFNILPYISLYFEQTTRFAACLGSLLRDLSVLYPHRGCTYHYWYVCGDTHITVTSLTLME